MGNKQKQEKYEAATPCSVINMSTCSLSILWTTNYYVHAWAQWDIKEIVLGSWQVKFLLVTADFIGLTLFLVERLEKGTTLEML